MSKASLYIFRAPTQRRKYLLDHADDGPNFNGYGIGEPVPKFAHSRNAPLIVLASFDDDSLTHVATGRKGLSAGTGLVRLNLTRVEKLASPIPFETLIGLVPSRFRAPLRSALTEGGLLPPKTFSAVVEALRQHDTKLAERLSRLSQTRTEQVRALTPEQRANLALQKETVSVALEVAGLPRDVVLDWSPSSDRPASFLEGLPGAYLREDAMLAADFTNLPGFKAIQGASHIAGITFENPDAPDQRVTVIMANRLPLEEQTGADLIYYNELYRAFVLVQYKAMEKSGDRPEFRWQDGDQFLNEIARMEALLQQIAQCPPDDGEPDGFRLSSNPFFLKFCPRVDFNPDDKGLVKGIYLPLDLWKALNSAGRLTGAAGGKVLSYDNVGRRLTNSEFVMLVGNSWVGTTIPQSSVLEEVIRSVLESGKTVTFAVKRSPPPTGHGLGVTPKFPADAVDPIQVSAEPGDFTYLVDDRASDNEATKRAVAIGRDESFE